MVSVKDMADMIYIRDAYDSLNNSLFGVGMIVGFHEGNMGAISRIHNLIERNAAEELKKNDCEEVWKIADDTSKTAEERAEMLLKTK